MKRDLILEKKSNDTSCEILEMSINKSLLIVSSILLLITIAHPIHSQPIEIGNRRQVFIDHKFIKESEGVELAVHQPLKTGDYTIQPEHPWESGGIGPYSSVLKVGDTYHMWYHSMSTPHWDTGHDRGAICYARSNDGVNWEKPALGLTEFEGSRENNIVFGHGAAGKTIDQDGGMVFYDPNAPDNQKFKLVVGRADLYSSPDGINWELYYPSVLTLRPDSLIEHHLDSQNIIFWDESINKYVTFGRRNTTKGRSIFRGEAETLDKFPMILDLPIVLGPDSMDLKYGDVHLVDYYMSAAIKYPWADNAYYMFPTAYFHYIPNYITEFKDENPRNAGPLHTQFAASTDGNIWYRYDRVPFIGLGMKGEFDWASTRMFYGIVPALNGREIYMYYRASDWLHGWDRDKRNKNLLTGAGLGASENIAAISRVVLRREGFVSVRGAYTGGEFTTPLVRFTGNQLLLNVNTSATGIVRAEILDADSKPIDGYSMEDCDRIHTTNEINRVVGWKGKSDISMLADKPIRLRFEIRDADLFAFQFK